MPELEKIVFGEQPRALVSWSGGRDSTLLLIHLLSETDKPVRAVTIETDQIAAAGIQRVVMTSLKKELEAKYREFSWETIRIQYEPHAGVFAKAFGQCLTWLTTLSLYTFLDEDLYIGYVRGDDVWHIRTEMFELYNTITKIGEKNGKLILPLEWADKTSIFTTLRDLGYLDKTWFCQDAGLRPCGECASCRTDKMYRMMLPPVDENVK